MAAPVPDREPEHIRAGDTWLWSRSLSDYPASTWTLKYQFRGSQGGFTFTATADGSDHAVTVTAATSAAYAPGSYDYIAWVESGALKHTVTQGRITVLPNLRSGDSTTPFDGRSHARQVLDALEATILGKASKDQLAMSIAGRSVQRMSPEEILKWRDKYKSEVRSEETADRLASGMGGAKRLLVRM